MRACISDISVSKEAWCLISLFPTTDLPGATTKPRALFRYYSTPMMRPHICTNIKVLVSYVLSTCLVFVKYIIVTFVQHALYDQLACSGTFSMFKKLANPFNIYFLTLHYRVRSDVDDHGLQCLRSFVEYNRIVTSFLAHVCRYCLDFCLVPFLVELFYILSFGKQIQNVIRLTNPRLCL